MWRSQERANDLLLLVLVAPQDDADRAMRVGLVSLVCLGKDVWQWRGQARWAGGGGARLKQKNAYILHLSSCRRAGRNILVQLAFYFLRFGKKTGPATIYHFHTTE